MKLWIYWMDNDYSKHFEERELPKCGDNRVDYEDASYTMYIQLNNGEIRDYQVELRK